MEQVSGTQREWNAHWVVLLFKFAFLTCRTQLEHRGNPVPMDGVVVPPGLLEGATVPPQFGCDENNTWPEDAVIHILCCLLGLMSRGLYAFVRELLRIYEMDDVDGVRYGGRVPSIDVDFNDGNRLYGSFSHLNTLLAGVHVRTMFRRAEAGYQAERLVASWELACRWGILSVVGGRHWARRKGWHVPQRYANLREVRIMAIVGYVSGSPCRRCFTIQDLANTVAYHMRPEEGLTVLPIETHGFADSLYNFRLWFLAVVHELKSQQLQFRCRAGFDVVFDAGSDDEEEEEEQEERGEEKEQEEKEERDQERPVGGGDP